MNRGWGGQRPEPSRVRTACCPRQARCRWPRSLVLLLRLACWLWKVLHVHGPALGSHGKPHSTERRREFRALEWMQVFFLAPTPEARWTLLGALHEPGRRLLLPGTGRSRRGQLPRQRPLSKPGSRGGLLRKKAWLGAWGGRRERKPSGKEQRAGVRQTSSCSVSRGHSPLTLLPLSPCTRPRAAGVPRPSHRHGPPAWHLQEKARSRC